MSLCSYVLKLWVVSKMGGAGKEMVYEKKNDMAEGRKCGMKRFPFRGFNEIPVLVAKMYF